MDVLQEDDCLRLMEQNGFKQPLLVYNGESKRVYQCKGENGENAVKCVNLKTHSKEYENEVSILQHLCHNNIVSFRGADSNQHVGIIVTEWVETDLLERLKTSAIPPEDAVDIFKQICLAVSYLHSQNISHLDLRPESILLSGNTVKMTGFGCSLEYECKKKYTSHCGTFFYCAPEILKNESFYPDKADIWSLGILLHVILTRSWPYCGASEGSIHKAVQTVDISFKLELLSSPAVTLLDWMLDPDAIFRPTIQEVLDHPWFLSIRARSSISAIKRSLSSLFITEYQPEGSNAGSESTPIPINCNESEITELSQKIGLKSPRDKPRLKTRAVSKILAFLRKLFCR